MVSQKVKEIILDEIDFKDEKILNAVENLATSVFNLAEAGYEFDTAFAKVDNTQDQVSDGILDLARAFSAVVAPDKNQAVKAAFTKVFTSSTPEQEKAGENLFSAALDFNISASELNELYAEGAENPGTPA